MRNLKSLFSSTFRPKVVTPSEFMSCFQKLNPQFRGYRQQVFNKFLVRLHGEYQIKILFGGNTT